MEMELTDMPPAPTADKPVTISLENGHDAWMAFHNLEIVGYDEKRGAVLVRKKTNKVIPAPTTTEAL
jgi:hypothetical protein